jgi:hypothetical protein
MIENDQLRQCVININQRFQHLLLIHRQPNETLIEIDNDEEAFETRN